MTLSQGLQQITQKDLYSQNGEGLCLEYILHRLPWRKCLGKTMLDIGAGDGFHLSNSRHLQNLGWTIQRIDKQTGQYITAENALEICKPATVVSIDIDGNDYWILDKILPEINPEIVVAEFNPNFDDARTIKYNPDHVWDGTDYFGFSFSAGLKLAEKHGYRVVHTIGNMNMFMVSKSILDKDLYDGCSFSIEENDFQKSNREDWVWV